MESKKLEKPRENGTFSTVQGVMKPDEEDRGVFPTKNPRKQAVYGDFLELVTRLERATACCW